MNQSELQKKQQRKDDEGSVCRLFMFMGVKGRRMMMLVYYSIYLAELWTVSHPLSGAGVPLIRFLLYFSITYPLDGRGHWWSPPQQYNPILPPLHIVLAALCPSRGGDCKSNQGNWLENSSLSSDKWGQTIWRLHKMDSSMPNDG